MNPYQGLSFFAFFPLFFERLFLVLSGQLSLEKWTIDELQIASLALLSISCALLGAFLLLRRSLMIATALSHTVLLGIVSAWIIFRYFGASISVFYESLPFLFLVSLLAAFFTYALEEVFSRVLQIQQDASIALVFHVLFAAGVLFVTLFTKNTHLGTEVMSGNIDALSLFDVKVLGLLALVNTLFFSLCYPGLLVTSFDPILARNLGCSLLFYRGMLFLMTSTTIIAAFRSVGIVLVLAFLTLPYLTARVCTYRLISILLLSPLFGVSAALIGAALSRHLLSVYTLAVSTSAIITLVLFLQYGAMLAFVQKQAERKRTSP
ncbi:MAG: metal ABC transporter permease [Chlamydiota bacterium]